MDADEFLGKLQKLAESLKKGEIGEIDINLLIASTPIVDAVEVVHGQWIHRPDKRICPLCNYRYPYFGGEDYNYCPNCGTKMNGGE